jgi:hypothetical protein
MDLTSGGDIDDSGFACPFCLVHGLIGLADQFFIIFDFPAKR